MLFLRLFSNDCKDSVVAAAQSQKDLDGLGLGSVRKSSLRRCPECTGGGHCPAWWGAGGRPLLHFSSAHLRADCCLLLLLGHMAAGSRRGEDQAIACCQCVFISLRPHYRHHNQPHFLQVTTLWFRELKGGPEFGGGGQAELEPPPRRKGVADESELG